MELSGLVAVNFQENTKWQSQMMIIVKVKKRSLKEPILSRSGMKREFHLKLLKQELELTLINFNQSTWIKIRMSGIWQDKSMELLEEQLLPRLDSFLLLVFGKLLTMLNMDLTVLLWLRVSKNYWSIMVPDQILFIILYFHHLYYIYIVFISYYHIILKSILIK